MSVRTLRTLNELFTRDDGRLEPDEAQRLVDASRDARSVTEEERAQLRLVASSPRTTLSARNVIEVPLTHDVAQVTEVTVRAEGYRDHVQQVRLRAGKVQTVQVRLEPVTATTGATTGANSAAAVQVGATDSRSTL